VKVRRLRVECFKRFKEQVFDFTDEESGLPKDLVVLVGPNGSGKSSVLQAIAALMSQATGRLERVSGLDWPGFDLSLAGGAWRTPLSLEVEVEFSPQEIASTNEYHRRTLRLRGKPKGADAYDLTVIRLRLRDDKAEADSWEETRLFRGREDAASLLRYRDAGHDVLRTVGTVLWYTEHRTSTTISLDGSSSTRGTNGAQQTKEIPPDLLRDRLGHLMAFHERVVRDQYQLRDGERDLFGDLLRLYNLVFPNRGIETTVPRSGVNEVLDAPWVYFWDGHRQYEFVEMSGGERAVFPILFDFANWHVHNSVILIDEIELHLHPPLQQALITALPELGRNNQFIITTHSDSVEAIVPPSSIMRLEDD